MTLTVDMRRDNYDGRATYHVRRFPRPSPSVFAYYKRSKTGGVEGLGTRLISLVSLRGDVQQAITKSILSSLVC